MALTDKLTDIADAIRAKTGESDLLTLDEMPDAIAGISGGGSAVDNVPQTINYTGSLNNHFQNDRYKWLIENYSNRLQFNAITALREAFNSCTLLPSNDINISVNYLLDCNSAFSNIFQSDTTGLVQVVPYIKGGILLNGQYAFYNSHIQLPNNWFNQFALPNGTGALTMTDIFSYSIIHQIIDMNNDSIVDNQQFTTSRNAYQILPFNYVHSSSLVFIDGLINIPVGSTRTKPTTAATMTWRDVVCKRLTFKLNNGVPYHANWNKLTLDLSNTGWIAMMTHNSVNSEQIKWFGQGNYTENLILQHQITDATSAENLKDDPWRWSSYVEGSLYNKTAALETIATLPDLTASNSTATIIFSGDAGAFTSGGAIGSMTSAEIAVATNKGWTVQFV